MTDQSQEPTMEEILASIRRIISEDDAPADTAGTTSPAATAPAEEDTPVEAPTSFAPPAEPEPPAGEDDVLELTDRYEAPSESIGDLDVMDPADAPFPAAPHPTPADDATHASPAYDTLVGDSAAASAASAFAGLAASFKKPDAAPDGASGIGGVTVEALARQLLRPMLKEWRDAHLPAIVEAQVRKEVERIARSA